MKKVLTAIMVLAMVGIATADISIKWKQSNAVIGNHAGTQMLTDGYAQLIWSLTAPTANTRATVADPDLLAAGECLLDDIAISGSTDGLKFSEPGAIFADSDVDGNAITDGAFYTRIFDAPDKASVTNGPNGGTWYEQSPIRGPGLTTYDLTTPATVYSDNVLAPGSYPVDDAQVVPEPNSIVLLGLLGVGVYRYRKSQQKI